MTRADDILARMRADTEHPWPTNLCRAIMQVESRTDRPVSATEKDVLRCLSNGTGIDGAAELLRRSRYTIEDQVKSARRRLRAKDNAHAVALAIRQGLIA